MSVLSPFILALHAALLAHPDRVTFADHVRPIFASRCLNCHNPEKLKGDLDLSTYAGVMTGGSGGAVIASGDADGSALVGVVSHSREPKMPPNGDRISQAEVEMIRAWIAGGCPETANSAAVGAAPARPKVSLGGTAAPSGPREALRLPMDARPPVERPPSARAMTSLDHSAVVAIAGRREVLFFDAERSMAIGALATDEDDLHALRFSRDGRVFLAAGGVDGKSGRVWLWSLPEGTFLAHVGDEVDAVLAADVDTRRDRVALGGPQRVVKIVSVGDNKVIDRIRKHTDWITAIAYSPDGVLLATADRAGGVQVWEAETLAPYQSLAGHTARVTGLDWSADSNMLVSASEDGRVRLWSMQAGPDGAVAKEWVADPTGVLALRVTSDNRVVTAGRDRTVKAWDASGTALVSYPALPDIATCVAVCEGSDGAARTVVGADLVGTVQAWSASDAKPLATLPTAVPPLEDRLAAARAALLIKEKSHLEATAAMAAAVSAKDAATAAQGEANQRVDAATSAVAAAATAREGALAAHTAAAELLRLAETARSERRAVLDAAHRAVESLLAGLAQDVERDRATQAALVAAEAASRDADASADEAERVAAGNDDPTAKSAAQAKRSAAQSAGEQAASAKSAAEASTATLKGRVGELDQAKAAASAATEGMRSAQEKAEESGQAVVAAKLALDAAEAKKAAADLALASAQSDLAGRAADVATTTQAVAAAESSFARARLELDAAGLVVRWHEAGLVRRERDKTRIEWQAALTPAQASVDTAVAAEEASKRAAADLAAAEEARASAPVRQQGAAATLDAATKSLADAEAGLVAATNEAKTRRDQLGALVALAESMTASAAAQPTSAALASARDRLLEAKTALERADREAIAEVAVRTAALEAARRARQLAEEAIRTLDAEVVELPARIDALRTAMVATAMEAEVARSAADAALAPARAIQERLRNLESEYARLSATGPATGPAIGPAIGPATAK